MVTLGKEDSLKATITIKEEVDLLEYSKLIDNKEELLEYFMSYGYSEEELLKDEWHGEWYKKGLQAISKGKQVAIMWVSNEGEPIEFFLCEKGLDIVEFNDNVEVLYGEGGY
jgi:hypothetical protein